jgi:hypothetical protein
LDNKITTILPTLELKYNKEIISNSSNTNTINNNIIIKPTSENTNIEVPDIELPEPRIFLVKKSDTSPNISEFKETLIAVLISYFKNNVVLLNNLI